MLFSVETRKSVTEVEKAFCEAAARHKFGVLAVHDLRQKMRDKGVDFDKEVLVFEVCDPHQAKKVLDENMDISTALPCRVSVYREGDRTRLSTLKPTTLLDMFPNPALGAVAREVEITLLNIMKDAAAD